MELKPKQIRLSNGDRIWLLVGPDGVPHFDSTVFLVGLYQERKSPNTLRNVANALRVVNRFEAKLGISIKKNIQKGQILTRYQTGKLVAECGLSLKSDDEQGAEKRQKVVPFRKQKVTEDPLRVKPNTQRIRSYYIGRYIAGLVERETESIRCAKLDELISALSKFELMIKKLAPEHEGLQFDPERPLTEDSAQKITELSSDPQSALAASLFKQTATRKRNLLIIEILLSTGVRVSELAGLLIKDVLVEQQILRFVKNNSVRRLDTRSNRPEFKTRERPIMINKDLMGRLDEYITARKGGRPRGANHSYVFCATGKKASALSLSSYYRVVRTLERLFGSEWQKRISPHVLRHTFFDLWFREANDRYDFRNNPQLFDQVVAAAELTGGWRPDSQMIEHYKQRYVFEQANEVTLGTQRRMILGSKKKDSNGVN